VLTPSRSDFHSISIFSTIQHSEFDTWPIVLLAPHRDKDRQSVHLIGVCIKKAGEISAQRKAL